MSQTLEDLGDAIADALADNPVQDVLGVLCGSLVGLVRELTIRSGNDPEKTITLEGGPGQRKIEIHALPNAEVRATEAEWPKASLSTAVFGGTGQRR